uniref:Uncharacterized protein n=1 Tax=Anguilla anguilla TaxID=7936 RepID=A0A0E9T856_ANGAN
MYFPNYQINN